MVSCKLENAEVGHHDLLVKRSLNHFGIILLFTLPTGIVAFRQHLQNLARTKGILELNKVQMLYDQMRSEDEPSLESASPHLPDLEGGSQQVRPSSPGLGLSGSTELLHYT